jgi:hypothetical protein
MFCTVRASSKVYSFDAGKCRQARLELAIRALPHVNEWNLYDSDNTLDFRYKLPRGSAVGLWES